MTSLDTNTLRKEVKKKMIDLDLDRSGSYEIILPRLSVLMGRAVHKHSLSMALTGFRNGPSSREILEGLRALLESWPPDFPDCVPIHTSR